MMRISEPPHWLVHRMPSIRAVSRRRNWVGALHRLKAGPGLSCIRQLTVKLSRAVAMQQGHGIRGRSGGKMITADHLRRIAIWSRELSAREVEAACAGIT